MILKDSLGREQSHFTPMLRHPSNATHDAFNSTMQTYSNQSFSITLISYHTDPHSIH